MPVRQNFCREQFSVGRGVAGNTIIRFRAQWINQRIRFFPKQRTGSRVSQSRADPAAKQNGQSTMRARDGTWIICSIK